MAAVRLRAAGLAALRARIAALPAAARAGGDAGLAAVAEDAAAEVRGSLLAAAGPSAPGAPPADPAGRLARSVAVSPGPGRAVVTVGAPDAGVLEYGTVRMAARPFLRPAAFKAGGRGRDLLRAALRRALAR